MTPDEVKAVRFSLHKSQSGLAELLGYSRNYIKNIERGAQPVSKRFEAGMRRLIHTSKTREFFVLKSGVSDSLIALVKARECACGCGIQFIPSVWNQIRLPGHPRRRR